MNNVFEGETYILSFTSSVLREDWYYKLNMIVSPSANTQCQSAII